MAGTSILSHQARGTVYTVAEIGQAHDGSLGILHSFIDACAATGVDAVKAQVHIAQAESSLREPFRKRFSYVDKTRYDYWQRMELSKEQWFDIKRHCEDVGVEFLATPFSIAAVNLLESIGIARYKIGSGDVSNALLIDRIAATGKEAIISTGLATAFEIGNAVEALRHNGIAVLQCESKYPTDPEDVGLSAIGLIRDTFKCPAGLSDHSGTIFPGLAAAALGASVVEFHVTFDRRMFGPDASASLTIDEAKELIRGIRFIEKARKGGVGKELNSERSFLRETFGRSLAVNKSLPKGHVIEISDLETKKPSGEGVSAADFRTVIGRRVIQDLDEWQFLTVDDFE